MKDKFISASELARLDYCERQVAFDAAHGRRTTPVQREASDRGRRAHEEFLREGNRIARASERKGRCFIATLALGEGRETTALRQFRDLFLRRSWAGRQFIAMYYRASPPVCRFLKDRPLLLRLCGMPLRVLARCADKAVRRAIKQPEGGHGW